MKKLIIYFDGTNGRFRENNANVVKTYRVTSDNNQIKCYIPGVGSSMNVQHYFLFTRWWKRLVELSFGHGIQERILAAYRFLSEQYEEGDEIYLFGFSRGAYMCKVLAGLLFRCGLIERQNAYNIQYAFNLYTDVNPDFTVMARFKNTFSYVSPKIKFMGLFDSVSSVGTIIQMRNYPDTSNIKNVEIVRHAIAVDEKRFMFVNNTSNSDGDNIQMWFPGVHIDVGGGSEESESELSKVPLVWMLEEAKRAGLDIDTYAYKRYIEGQDASKYVGPSFKGKMHSNNKLWYALNFIPRVKRIGFSPTKYKLIWPLIRYRDIEDDHQIHKSVDDRMAFDKNYRPTNISKWKSK